MKIIYISHVPFDSTYGAGTSFRNQIKIVKDNPDQKKQIVIFYRVTIKQYIKYFFLSIKFFFSKKILAIPIFCDWDINYDYDHNKNLLKNEKIFLNRILYEFSSIAIRLLINIFKPDIVHLNSHVLSKFWYRVYSGMPIKKKRFKVICHVRDMISNLNKESIKKLKFINCFICIDFATKKRLIQECPFLNAKTVIIPNPFERTLSKKKLCNLNCKTENYDLVIGFVGTLIKDKGICFILDAFSKYRTNKKILFIIVGDGPLYKNLRNKINEIKDINIEMIGLVDSLSQTNFYDKIDLLIRGDKSFRTGRTVFESLYEGKSVLIPQEKNIKIKEPQLYEFKEIVFLYKARNEKSFLKEFDSFVQSHKNIIRKKKRSNFVQYENALFNVYNGV